MLTHCDCITFTRKEEHMQNKHPPTGWRKWIQPKIALYAAYGIGGIVVICVLALMLFGDPLANKFVKPRITKAFVEAYPTYSLRIGNMHYSVLTNRFGFDSVAMSALDDAFSGTMGAFSVGGVGWIHLLWGGSLVPQDFANSTLDAKEIVLKLRRSQYILHCKHFRVSAPNSELVTESLEIQPLGGDEQFFKSSAFRKTRFSIVIPQCSVKGLACLGLLQGREYRAQSVQIHSASLDIMVNKEKPDPRDTTGPFMPNEILSSIKPPFQINSVSVTNGQLIYRERFEATAEPAFITFDNMQVSAEGITNHGDRNAPLIIHAKSQFAKAGTMTVQMSIPVASPTFSFQYSGSLSEMELSPINSFLEVSDHMRIKAGALEGATYEINVVSGRAVGTVSGVYRNLTLAAINKNRGSDKGIGNRIHHSSRTISKSARTTCLVR
jgi:hypothetical protein